MQTMKAIVFEDGQKWSVQELEIPTPNPDEVLIKVIRTGVCGTDAHVLEGGFIAELPVIPGHEILGEVVEVGSAVTTHQIGEMVAVDNATACGECSACLADNHLFCENFHSLGLNAPGGFAEYVSVKAVKAFNADGLDIEVAGLAEPLACIVHGLDVLDMRPGAEALVFGAGPTGLIFAQMLKAAGASSVTLAAPTRSKLDLALNLGVDRVVQIPRGDSRAGEAKLREMAPEGFEVVIEATGAPTVLELAVDLAAVRGTVMVYGVAKEGATASLKPYDIFSKELTIKGSFAQIHSLGRAVDMMKAGALKADGIVTDIVGFEDFDRALSNLSDSEQVKTVFEPR